MDVERNRLRCLAFDDYFCELARSHPNADLHEIKDRIIDALLDGLDTTPFQVWLSNLPSVSPDHAREHVEYLILWLLVHDQLTVDQVRTNLLSKKG